MSDKEQKSGAFPQIERQSRHRLLLFMPSSSTTRFVLMLLTHILRSGLQISRRLRRLQLWPCTAAKASPHGFMYRSPLSLVSHERRKRRRYSIDHSRFADRARKRKDALRSRYRCTIGFEDL